MPKQTISGSQSVIQKKSETEKDQIVQSKIYTIRNQQIMIDRDLAELYGVETKVLNQAVKRNIERFPQEFMFSLTNEEARSLRSQNVTLEMGRGKHRKYLPHAFTEQGVAMLSAVLKSDVAIKVSIKIIKAFVVMRCFIQANALFLDRLNSVENKQLAYQIDSDKKFERVFKALEISDIKPKQGIFFDGQMFDAYLFVSGLIKKANKSIILIDNYIDESVLTLFLKRKKGVSVEILTRNISRQLSLDLEKYNSQYEQIKIKEFDKSHDRFLIIDGNEVYHIGASLKDLGKKWFAFSKIDKGVLSILDRLD